MLLLHKFLSFSSQVGYGKVPGVGASQPPPPPGRTSASGVDAIYNIKADQQRYVPYPVPGGAQGSGPGGPSVHHHHPGGDVAAAAGQTILTTFSPSGNVPVSPVLASMHSYGPPLMDGAPAHDEMDGHLV